MNYSVETLQKLASRNQSNGLDNILAHILANTQGASEIFNQTSKPLNRKDGSVLQAGDRWWNPVNQTEWRWNGTYWVNASLETLRYAILGSFEYNQSPSFPHFHIPDRNILVLYAHVCTIQDYNLSLWGGGNARRVAVLLSTNRNNYGSQQLIIDVPLVSAQGGVTQVIPLNLALPKESRDYSEPAYPIQNRQIKFSWSGEGSPPRLTDPVIELYFREFI